MEQEYEVNTPDVEIQASDYHSLLKHDLMYDMIHEKEEYETKTRGHRHKPPARALGEGVYHILRHQHKKDKKMHTHLIYKLEFPSTEGKAAEQQPQEALKVAQEASFLLQIKNPTQKGRNEFRGLKRKRKPVFPKHLQERFGKLRYHAADPPDFLNNQGCKFLLISASDNMREELGVMLTRILASFCSMFIADFSESLSSGNRNTLHRMITPEVLGNVETIKVHLERIFLASSVIVVLTGTAQNRDYEIRNILVIALTHIPQKVDPALIAPRMTARTERMRTIVRRCWLSKQVFGASKVAATSCTPKQELLKSLGADVAIDTQKRTLKNWQEEKAAKVVKEGGSVVILIGAVYTDHRFPPLS
ncbi:hypothetical protein Tco_1428840 [Tanacetum coccineum]